MRAILQIIVSTYYYWRKGVPTISLCFALARMDAQLKKLENLVKKVR